MRQRRVTCEQQYLPYRHPLAISRGVLNGDTVIVVTIIEGAVAGRGESCPSSRYQETATSVSAAIEQHIPALEAGLDRTDLQRLMPPGAARNAVDCALWDLEAKRTGRRIWDLVNKLAPRAILCSQTIGLDTPEIMAAHARAAWSPLLKLKVGGTGDIERVSAVRAAAPSARLIVDANEAWTVEQLEQFPAVLARLGVELIEQPLPAHKDDALARIACPLPIAADESFHDSSMVEDILGKYQWINIKLDKTGGLTEALRARHAAEQAGLRVMVGCMGGSSLAMAPAMVVAADVPLADLDAPQLLVRDCEFGLRYEKGMIGPYGPELWG